MFVKAGRMGNMAADVQIVNKDKVLSLVFTHALENFPPGECASAFAPGPSHVQPDLHHICRGYHGMHALLSSRCRCRLWACTIFSKNACSCTLSLCYSSSAAYVTVPHLLLRLDCTPATCKHSCKHSCKHLLAVVLLLFFLVHLMALSSQHQIVMVQLDQVTSRWPSE